VDLLVVTIVSLVLVPLAVFCGGNVVSLVLGLIFALFSPGYTLTAALFPKRDDLDGVQRLSGCLGSGGARTAGIESSSVCWWWLSSGL